MKWPTDKVELQSRVILEQFLLLRSLLPRFAGFLNYSKRHSAFIKDIAFIAPFHKKTRQRCPHGDYSFESDRSSRQAVASPNGLSGNVADSAALREWSLPGSTLSRQWNRLM